MSAKASRTRHIKRAVLAGFLSAMLLFGQSVSAAQSAPVREVHKVPAGEAMYCFFVEKNVVLTPGEIAAIESDEDLTREVLQRSGLSMSLSSCREHPAISMQEWIDAGNTLQLSEIDMIKLRQAAPVDGEPVKLHLDLRFTVKGADEDSVPAGESPAVEPEEPPAADPEQPIVQPEDPEGAAVQPEDAAGDTGNPDGEPAGGQTEGTDGGTETEPGDSDQQPDNPPDDPAADPGVNPDPEPDPEPAETPEEDPVKKRPVYSTFKKTSPELLFIVIATEADAAAAEDSCGPEEALEEPQIPAVPEMPEIPEGMDLDLEMLGELSEPADMLPELRTINMTAKNGPPVEETLQEGDPVSLEWIEPEKTISKSDFEKFLERFPGGAAGLGALLGMAAVGVGAAAVVIRRKRKEDY